MNSRRKLLVATALLVVGINTILYHASHRQLMASFEALEDDAGRAVLRQAAGVVEREIGYLQRLCGDWAFWDDAYRFVQQPTPEFITSNITPEVFNQLHLNVILFLDGSDHIVHSGSFDLARQQPMPLPPGLLLALPAMAEGERDCRSGLLVLEQGPAMAAVCPVLPSSLDLPPVGRLLIARLLNQEELERFSGECRLPLALEPLPPTVDGEVVGLQPLDPDHSRGTIQLHDFDGQPVRQLATVLPRDISRQGRETIRFFGLLALALTALGAAVLYLVALRLLEARERQQEINARYRALVDHIRLGIVLVGDDYRLQLANPAAGRLLPCSGGGRPGQHCYSLLELKAPCASCPGSRALQSGEPASIELDGRTADSDWLVRLHAFPVQRAEGGTRDFIMVIEDLRLEKEAQAEIERLSSTDELTGLPNRGLFLDRLEMALRQQALNNHQVALLYLDLDRFKDINDTLGHTLGDTLLRQASRRLDQCRRPEMTLARLGGDEFALLLPSIHQAREATDMADALLATLARPFRIDEHEIYISGSIGIVLAPADGRDGVTLLRHADIAMYAAKTQGRNGFHYYAEDLHRRACARRELAAGLHRALERNELLLEYQPQIDLRSGQLTGLEALVRWEHPQQGRIPPDQFIPVAEENGLIREIDRWVLMAACRQARDWRDAGLPGIRLAVNLSGQQFRQADVLLLVEQALADSGLPPQALELELTETVLMDDATATARILGELKARGVGLAVDDFGTGYSSLSYLKHFPIDRIKIDRGFVQHLGHGDDDAIVATIIAMARSLGREVVAEGVEIPAQIAFLQAHGCDAAQGYYFARPLPAAQVRQLLQDGLGREGVCLFRAIPSAPAAP